MERLVLKYIYLDFLVDSRVSKRFSDQSSAEKVIEVLEVYFDQAMDRKGFNYKKVDKYGSPYASLNRPDRYKNTKNQIVQEVSAALLNGDRVFVFEEHPLFGRKCHVDSEKFVWVVKSLLQGISLKDGVPLSEDIRRWGVSRFKEGLGALYESVGGFFDSLKWVDFEAASDDSDAGTVHIPAFDEIVQIDFESQEVVEISSLAKGLIQQLQVGNDLGNLSSQEASAAVTEIKQIITAFEGSRVRSRQLFEFSKGVLTWIASKGGEALVGAMATTLLALIATYFGYSL